MSIFKRPAVDVAVIQSRIVQGEKDQNIACALELFQKAMENKPKLVCFTQAFGSGINFIILDKMAEPIPDGRIATVLSSLAREHQIHITAGILELGEDGKIYDASVLFGPTGELLGKYRRFIRWSGELNYITQGERINCIDSEIGRIGLLSGYDICFAESCHHYFLQDVDLLICGAAVFEDLSYDVQHLCATRAMDNHCYFVYAGAIGEHQFANMWYMGNSSVTCDPYFMTQCLSQKQKDNMELLAKAGSGEEVIYAELYIKDLEKGRKKLPFHNDMRTALSGNLGIINYGI